MQFAYVAYNYTQIATHILGYVQFCICKRAKCLCTVHYAHTIVFHCLQYTTTRNARIQSVNVVNLVSDSVTDVVMSSL
jgi:hypothetical protein